MMMTNQIAVDPQTAPKPKVKPMDRNQMLAQLLMSQPAPQQNALGGLDQGLRNGLSLYLMQQ